MKIPMVSGAQARPWAAPCSLTRGERNYLFIEEIPSGAGKGHLAVLEMTAESITSDPQIILEKP